VRMWAMVHRALLAARAGQGPVEAVTGIEGSAGPREARLARSAVNHDRSRARHIGPDLLAGVELSLHVE
jgi:hypothetical protein